MLGNQNKSTKCSYQENSEIISRQNLDKLLKHIFLLAMGNINNTKYAEAANK